MSREDQKNFNDWKLLTSLDFLFFFFFLIFNSVGNLGAWDTLSLFSAPKGDILMSMKSVTVMAQRNPAKISVAHCKGRETQSWRLIWNDLFLQSPTRPGETSDSGVYFWVCHAKHNKSCLPSTVQPRTRWICLCMGEKGTREGLSDPPLLWSWRDSVSYSSELWF